MATAVVQEIENQFPRLPREAQSGAIERLVHRFRRKDEPPARHAWEASFKAMAADPEVRGELAFATTEANGLGRA